MLKDKSNKILILVRAHVFGSGPAKFWSGETIQFPIKRYKVLNHLKPFKPCTKFSESHDDLYCCCGSYCMNGAHCSLRMLSLPVEGFEGIDFGTYTSPWLHFVKDRFFSGKSLKSKRNPKWRTTCLLGHRPSTVHKFQKKYFTQFASLFE